MFSCCRDAQKARSQQVGVCPLHRGAALQPPVKGTLVSSNPLQVWRGLSPQPTGGRWDGRGPALLVGRRSPTTKPVLALQGACRPLPGPRTGLHLVALASGLTKSTSPPAPAPPAPHPKFLLLPPSSVFPPILAARVLLPREC